MRGCTRLYAKRGGGYPTKIKDMPIRDGFPHQFTPAVPKGTVADDGKRSPAMDVVESCLSYEKGGGLEEGGLQVAPERRDADDGKRSPAMDVVVA